MDTSMNVKLMHSMMLVALGCCLLAVLGMARSVPTPEAGTIAGSSLSEQSLLRSQDVGIEFNTTVVRVPMKAHVTTISIIDTRRILLEVTEEMDEIKHEGGPGSGAGFGSKPPICENKCGLCTPCVPSNIPVGSVHSEEEYYPQVWRCECDNKFYNP